MVKANMFFYCGYTLSESDKNYLRKHGVPDSDFPQINDAMKVTKYEYCPNNSDEGWYIDQDEVIKRVGIRRYLAGISRSAFHWSASQDTINKRGTVDFDSSDLFR